MDLVGRLPPTRPEPGTGGRSILSSGRVGNFLWIWHSRGSPELMVHNGQRVCRPLSAITDHCAYECLEDAEPLIRHIQRKSVRPWQRTGFCEEVLGIVRLGKPSMEPDGGAEAGQTPYRTGLGYAGGGSQRPTWLDCG